MNRALWFSVICRDHDRTQTLLAVDEHTLRTESSEGFDDYVFSWIDALEELFQNTIPSTFASASASTVPDKLRETSQLLDPADTMNTNPDYITKIMGPQILLLTQLASRNEGAFNDALCECLEAHREYWTVNEKASSNPRGYIALAPLAFTCVAYDYGFSIDVESDYLPITLIEGSRLRSDVDW